ncbi:flagellar hook-associated protein FlgK [Gilvimarinus polysaccharolyticus]|uniref:flagellar hook-associated protein FlgK n=1 Tax=Gilvimarinus polysaccharolyticus TaxID=863921 RepID=UPI000673B8A6|nr:flagellar hook-associated protein FlgK [Gilvimarinus polysaccharolyticus]
MAGLLSNAISGLQASQNALRTTGHNISNANTDGYSRQNVSFGTRPPQNIGSAGYIGSGVSTEAISRTVDQFILTQLRLDTATFNQLDTFNLNTGKIDSLLANSNTGLSGGLESFYAALQSAADDPSSTPARQLVIEQAKGLASRFNNLYDRFTSIENGVEGEINTIAEQINGLANSVAELNKAIIQLRGANGAEPNDLLDQRDEALRQLSELVSISVVTQDGGEMNVYMGSGQPLVVGNSAAEVSSNGQGDVFLGSTAGLTNVTAQVSGGKLGGLLKFNTDVLQPAQEQLGKLAAVVSFEINSLQAQGVDLNGEYGKNIFTPVSAGALTNVVGAGNFTVDVTDAGELVASDYDVVVAGGNVTITRLSDGAASALVGLGPHVVDGISFDATGSANGDSFRLDTNLALNASSIAVNQLTPQDLALAGPVRTEAVATNAGSGVISAGNVQLNPGTPVVPLIIDSPATPPATYNDVSIEFISSTQYKFVDSAGNDLATPAPGPVYPYTAGSSIYLEAPVGPAGTAYEFTIQGNPAPGDTFTISFNQDAVNDNRTALKMAALDSAITFSGGLSINEAYGQMVEQIGAKANLARMNTDAAQSVLEQTQSLRDSISGVNLDEEAANLIKFEQVYNANSQVISIARDLFDTLLNAV